MLSDVKYDVGSSASIEGRLIILGEQHIRWAITGAY